MPSPSAWTSRCTFHSADWRLAVFIHQKKEHKCITFHWVVVRSSGGSSEMLKLELTTTKSLETRKSQEGLVLRVCLKRKAISVPVNFTKSTGFAWFEQIFWNRINWTFATDTCRQHCSFTDISLPRGRPGVSASFCWERWHGSRSGNSEACAPSPGRFPWRLNNMRFEMLGSKWSSGLLFNGAWLNLKSSPLCSAAFASLAQKFIFGYLVYLLQTFPCQPPCPAVCFHLLSSRFTGRTSSTGKKTSSSLNFNPVLANDSNEDTRNWGCRSSGFSWKCLPNPLFEGGWKQPDARRHKMDPAYRTVVWTEERIQTHFVDVYRPILSRKTARHSCSDAKRKRSTRSRTMVLGFLKQFEKWHSVPQPCRGRDSVYEWHIFCCKKFSSVQRRSSQKCDSRWHFHFHKISKNVHKALVGRCLINRGGLPNS